MALPTGLISSGFIDQISKRKKPGKRKEEEISYCPGGKNGSLITGDVFQSCCGISYEYLNDIFVRTALEIVINKLPPDKSKLLKRKIIKTDEILKKLIIENANNRTDPSLFDQTKWWEMAQPKGVSE